MATDTAQRIRDLENERDRLWTECRNLRARMSQQWSAAVDRKLLGEVVAEMIGLPGVRGVWTLGAFDSAGNAQDCSGHGHHLTYNGNPTYNFAGFAPYVTFDGTGDYLGRADEADLDITGAETYVAPAAQGLTMGGWFYCTADQTDEGLMGKYQSEGNDGYLLQKRGINEVNTARMIVDNAGITTSGNSDISIDTWQFVVGRYIPSSTISIWINDSKTTNINPPASIGINDRQFEISGYNNGATELLTGQASLCFLCASALSEDLIMNLYARSKALF